MSWQADLTAGCPRCHGKGWEWVRSAFGDDVDVDMCSDCEHRARRRAFLEAHGHGKGADEYHRIASSGCDLCWEARYGEPRRD